MSGLTAASMSGLGNLNSDARDVCKTKFDLFSSGPDRGAQSAGYTACHGHYMEHQSRARAIAAGTFAYARVERERINAQHAASDPGPPPTIYGNEITHTAEDERALQAALSRAPRLVPLSTYMYTRYPALRGARIMSGHSLHKGPADFFYIKGPSGKTLVTGLRATSSGPLFSGGVGAQAPRPDKVVTQRVVAQTNVRNTNSVSAHAQAAAARGQHARAAASHRRAGTPGPMTDARQNQLILATQHQGGLALGTGAKVAVAALGVVTLIGLGALLFGGRR